jgi:hypothetical protein
MSATVTMPRERAEAVVAIGMDRYWPRFQFEIAPPGEPPMFFAKLLAFMGLVKTYRAIVAPAAILLLAAILALLAIHLPEPQYRIYAVGALAVVSFAAGFFVPHPGV